VNYEAIGKDYGYSDAEIAEYKVYLDMLVARAASKDSS